MDSCVIVQSDEFQDLPIINIEPGTLVEHAPILIESNSDFVDLGFSGTGTVEDPYIIEALNITATGASSAGIKVTTTSVYFEIKDCLILSEYIGIVIMSIASSTCSITNNVCISSSGDGGGIGISSSSGCNITENECSNFMQGIHLNSASSCLISSNLINSNNYQGINIRYSNLNTITYNQIKNSEQHGIALVGTSSSNIIHHNTFINNSLTSQYTIDGERTGTTGSQGYDEGSNNKWYDEVGKYGNHWSDYSGSGTYSIDGSSASEDLYPLMLDVDESEFVNLRFSSIIILGILLGFYRKIRNRRNV